MLPDEAARPIEDTLSVHTVTTNLAGPIRVSFALIDPRQSRAYASSPSSQCQADVKVAAGRIRIGANLMRLGDQRLGLRRLEARQ